MSKEIVIALIAAFVSLIGTILTLIIGLRNIRLQRTRLDLDSKRLESEIAKLRAEADKISAETADMSRRRYESERAEIRELLLPFDRLAFDEDMEFTQSPTGIFRAIQETRIVLQMNGASLLPNEYIAEQFKEIRKLLMEFEALAITAYPQVVRQANDPSYREYSHEQEGAFFERWVDEYRPKINCHIRNIRVQILDIDLRMSESDEKSNA